ncbi:glycerophosphodiester phosphodiesterase [Nocardioides acrostichi]|uniref:GP-PDE domain-containing protein n=1 Tax=Nocardioides acrostichi TaxID=2784339 RepID=A0A930V0I4_9ACTN|nr:glycerophosphodiester phosphodiesterase [Nocardioides acrostichi]MBF4163137.1 hypothetical protein [Nocardioides acrostichi]
MLRRPSEPVLVSAHRCGAGSDRSRENTAPALRQAVAMGVDYVEFDVQALGDGTFVCYHDDRLADGAALADLDYPAFARQAPDHLRYDTVLAVLAEAGVRAHIDLKLVPEPGAAPGVAAEVRAAEQAVAALGADRLVVTTLEDASVRVVRDWADARGLDLLVGLSLGRRVAGLPWYLQLRIRRSEVLPRLRVRRSRANVIVANHALARLGVAAFARRRGLPLLVWTVDTERSLRYWLQPGRAWLVTSNEPGLALAVRDGLPDSRRER